jgi:hypothetical protein
MNIQKALELIPIDTNGINLKKLNKAYIESTEHHLHESAYPSTFVKLKQSYEILFYQYINTK